MNKRIRLPKGWYMVLDGSTREEGEFQGFVFAPNGRSSASLNWALECGCTSDGAEIEIPAEVMAELGQYAEKYS